MCEEKVTKISEPNKGSKEEINTEEAPLLPPKIRKNAKEENVDPIEEVRRKKELEKQYVPLICACKESIQIEPTISCRMTYKFPEQSVCDETKEEGPKPEYEYRPTAKFLRIQKQNKKDTALKFFCEWRSMNLDKPMAKRKIETGLDVPSPGPSKAKVALKKTCPRPSLLYPDPQTDAALKEQQPKSGIFLNPPDKENAFEDYDSFDLLYQKKTRPPWPTAGGKGKGKKGKGSNRQEDCTCDVNNPCSACKSKTKKKKKNKEETDEDVTKPAEEEEEEELTKFFRKKVSLMSMATSYNDKDLAPSDEPEDYPPRIAKILQKFRRESDIKRFGPHRRKFKRGTLQSHSFTDVCQPTLKDFFFGSKEGTMHQGDESFPERIKNKQGVCMPVAAFCYSIITHPNKWTREIVDDILIYGNNLLIESLDEAHIHNLKTIVPMNVLRKYITIGDKKFRFHIGDPYIAGYIRSDDKIVYNITKALSIFFARHNSGILKTKHLSIGIWKQKYLYLFDAKARTKDLYCCPTGAAIMAVFYDVQSLATVLLTRSNFGNWPFAIHPLTVCRVIPADELEVDSETGLDIRSEYNILNENKAVVLGSFDLGDKCFDFSRYKQSLPMSVVALVYSRLTPPSAWHRKTVDKILIIGNLLYRECICCTTSEEVKLENIPAIFTIGKCHLAVWKQRNMLYCFDPYSRNNEGYTTRDGCACVSMHSTLESLIEIISHNFDKDAIFYVHALKVCKIHRDPVQTTAFPKHISMDEFPLDCFKTYKMKKSKKNATEKPVTVDYSAIAMRRLLAGESPHASIVEIGSHVESLAMDQLNALMKKCPSKPCVAFHPIPIPDIADLDSPSLEDTQIEPPLPQQIDEAIEFMDLDSFGPTMDELEMGGDGEGEEYGEYEADVEGILMDDMEGEGEGEEGWYYGKTGYSQFDMAGLKITEQINTDITYFPIKRDILYPTDLSNKREMKNRLERARLKGDDWENYLPPCPPTVTKSQELCVETNFADLPDDTQIILGSKNISQGDDDVEYLAPFVCIMAGVVANKYRILTWSQEVVDYVLKCGTELRQASKFRFDQVAKLEIPRITLGSDVFKVLVEYIFDSYTRQNILELALDKFLFVRSDTGVIVTPTYACAVMFRNHLYYLYDPFGNNELGLSEGVGKKGVAFFARFKDVHSLAARIMFNKRKRETIEEVVYSRFVLSSVKVRGVYDYSAAAAEAKKKERDVCKSTAKPVAKKEEKKEKKEPEKPENKVGYRCIECDWMIVGTKKLPDRNVTCENLKEDHFMCICAIFMLLTIPVERWSTRTVDLVYTYGRYVYSKATELYVTDKSTIRNILIRKHFFDAVVKHLEITSKGANKDLYRGLATVFARKFTYFLVHFPNICLTIHKSSDGLLHIFDPYGALDKSPAGWLRCKDMKEMKKYLSQKIECPCGSYRFYTLDIIHIHKAPKSIRLSTELEMFTMKPKPPKKEKLGKPLHEDSDWLKMDPIMWSRKHQRAANGNIRGTIENMWHNWDIEYENDLWSLLGNINQRNERFAETNRGNQTLANLIIAIAMTKIYELEEWNSAVVDSVLVNGDIYFTECTKDKKDANYELALEDLKPDAKIFPFSFKVKWSPDIEGIMFLVRACQFNLYKALRSFFANVESRCGIIMLTKTAMKRQMAFGKIKDSEYFVFDCDCRGNPMFLEHTDLAYILRMTTMNRLLHVLTLTLRGGEFFIYETVISDMKPMGAAGGKTSC